MRKKNTAFLLSKLDLDLDRQIFRKTKVSDFDRVDLNMVVYNFGSIRLNKALFDFVSNWKI